MYVSLIVRVCNKAAVFDRRYARDGESYVHLLWAGDGYELYMRKTLNDRQELIVDKATMARLLSRPNFSQLHGLISGIFSSKHDYERFFKQLPGLVRDKRSVVLEKDGSFVVEP